MDSHTEQKTPRILTWNLQIGSSKKGDPSKTWEWNKVEKLIKQHDIIFLQEVVKEIRDKIYGDKITQDFEVHPKKPPSDCHFTLVTLVRKKEGECSNEVFRFDKEFTYGSCVSITANGNENHKSFFINLHLKADRFKNEQCIDECARRKEMIEDVLYMLWLDRKNIAKIYIGGDFNCDEKEADHLIDLFNKIPGLPKISRCINPFATYISPWNGKVDTNEIDYIASSESEPTAFTRFNPPCVDFVKEGTHFPVSSEAPCSIAISKIEGNDSTKFESKFETIKDRKRTPVFDITAAKSSNRPKAFLRLPVGNKNFSYILKTTNSGAPILPAGFLNIFNEGEYVKNNKKEIGKWWHS